MKQFISNTRKLILIYTSIVSIHYINRSAYAEDNQFSGGIPIVEVVLGTQRFKIPETDILSGSIPKSDTGRLKVDHIELIGTIPNKWGLIPPGVINPGSKDSADSMVSNIRFVQGLDSVGSLLPTKTPGEKAQFDLIEYKNQKVGSILYVPAYNYNRRIEIISFPPGGNLNECRLYTTFGKGITIQTIFNCNNLRRWKEIDQSVQDILYYSKY